MANRELAPLGGSDPMLYQPAGAPPAQTSPSSLADILERVLDKGIVIAGDIQINLLEIELLTIKLRLLIASVDRAREMGINWWESDASLSSYAKDLEQENQDLRERLERLEEKVGLPAGGDEGTGAGEKAPARRARKKH